MRKETLILAGMPGSGKTMFSENIVCAYGENKETIFSRNTMRGKLGVCKPGERAVLPNPFGLKVTHPCHAGTPVIDSTNSKYQYRKNVAETCKNISKEVGDELYITYVIFETDIETCIYRSSGMISEKDMRKLYDIYQRVTTEGLEEFGVDLVMTY